MIRPSQNEIANISSAMSRSAKKSVPIASALFTALQAKHAPTAYHCLRVAQNITAWGLYHGIERELLSQLEVLGLLHDVGKIGIPERILQKPDRLNEQERAIISMHPCVGAEILTSAGLDASIVLSVSRLGEWYDGTNRKTKDDILPIHGRVLAIADAFDAMITEQRYRPAMKLAAALEELERMAGSQFDPSIVPTFTQAALACDDTLQRDVEERWKSFGFGDHVADLFNHSPTIQASNVADSSLTSIFHRRLADHMNDGVIFIDTEYKILEWNRTAESMTGCSRSSLLHQRWTPSIVNLQDETGVSISDENCPLLAVVRGNSYRSMRLSLEHVDGSRRAVQVQVLPIHDDRGVVRGASMIFDDITRQKNLEQAVEKLHLRASIDPLTKVHNRAELNLQLQCVSQAVAESESMASVIICDIDFFKRINDTYGHAAGDEALVAFASILKECSRELDLVARYGGEEFVILCRDCSVTDAVNKAETIRRTLGTRPLPSIRGKCLSASFGVAAITPFCNGEAAINSADAALLRAKQNGRNRVERADRETPREVEVKAPEESKSSSWLSWLGSSSPQIKKQVDILVVVPPELAVEKLRGFLDDWNATPTSTKEGFIQIAIDLRKAPAYVRSSDHDASFQLEVQIQQVDYLPQDERKAAYARTMVTATLMSTTRRNRRADSTEELMTRIIKSFNRYIVGEILTPEARRCVHVHARR